MVSDFREGATRIIQIAVIIAGFASAVLWVAASKTIMLLAPYVAWSLAISIISIIAAGTGLILIWLYYKGKLFRAEKQRDYTLIVNEAKQSDMEIERIRQQIDFERAALVAQANQMMNGTVYANRLGEAAFASHTKAAIMANDSMPLLPETVLPDFVRIEDYVQSGNVTLRNLVLGVGMNNEIIRGSLRELSHIGVAGTSRWGKSIFLQVLLYQILVAREKVDLYLSDLGGTTYVDLGIPYADDVASTEKMTMNLWDRAMERKALFQATGQGIRSLDIYNQIADPLPYVVFACDEVTAIFSESKRLQHTLKNLVLYAGKYGIELILSGQNWKSTNVDSTLRDQFSSRFQFKAMDRYQASMLISDSGADEINVKGRCYAWIPERGETIQMQAPFIETETLQAIARPAHALLGDDMPVWDLKPVSGSNDSETDSEVKPSDSDQQVIDLWLETHNWSKVHMAATATDTYPGGTDIKRYKSILDKWGIDYSQ